MRHAHNDEAKRTKEGRKRVNQGSIKTLEEERKLYIPTNMCNEQPSANRNKRKSKKEVP